MPCPLLIFSRLDYLIQVVDTNSPSKWQTTQTQVSWLLQKPTDLDWHCLQKQGISGISRTRVNIKFCILAARRSARKARESRSDETTSPPAKGRRVDSSPGGDLAPLPSSPAGPADMQNGEESLFSSPPQSRAGGMYEGCWKISGLFLLLSFQVQLPTHITIHREKYILSSMNRSFYYAPNFEEVGGAYCFWVFVCLSVGPFITLFDA